MATRGYSPALSDDGTTVRGGLRNNGTYETGLDPVMERYEAIK